MTPIEQRKAYRNYAIALGVVFAVALGGYVGAAWVRWHYFNQAAATSVPFVDFLINEGKYKIIVPPVEGNP